MRSASLLFLSSAALTLASATPLAGNVLDGVVPASTRYGNDRTTGAVLESLRILPDDDNDGILDIAGSLKVLEDGELLTLGGVVRVGNVLDACIEVMIDGVPTKRCGDGGRRGRKHRNHSLSKDDWTKEEHRMCSSHFKSWHKQHGSQSCSDRLREAEKKIRELERRLTDCRPDSDYKPYHPSSNIKIVNPSNNGGNNDGSAMPPQPTWSPSASGNNNPSPEEHHWTPENSWKPEPGHDGEHWRDETEGKDCRQGVYTYTDKNGINVKACIAASVDIGPVHADAQVKADANIDLKNGKVSAKAQADAKVGVDGVAELTTKNDVKADLDLKKGQADIKISTDDTLKLGDTKVIDTGLNAEVKLNKNCPQGELINALGVCVKLTSDNKHGDSDTPLGLGNALGGIRAL